MTCNATITYRHFTVDWKTAADVNEKGEVLYAHSSNTDMNKQNDMLEIEKEGWKFGRKLMTEEEVIAMYPNWDTMNRADQQAARKLYGLPTSHGNSNTGGALHMTAASE